MAILTMMRVLMKFAPVVFAIIVFLLQPSVYPNKVYAASTHVSASTYSVPYQGYNDVTFTIYNPLEEDFRGLNILNNDNSFSGNNVTLPISCVNSTCTANLRHFGNNYGTWPIHYSIFDSNNNILYSEDDLNVFTVIDMPIPVVSEIVGPSNPVVNAEYTYSASFTEDSSTGPHTVEWNWSDGTYTYGTVSESGGTGTVSANHIFTETRPYPYGVVLTVFDNVKTLNFSQLTVNVVPNEPTPTPTPTVLAPISDSYIKQGSQNENEGSSTFLRLQQSGHNRILLKFDQSQIQQAVGNSQNYSATLKLVVTDNGNNWGNSGRNIEVHKLLQNWGEGNGFIDGNNPSYRGVGSGSTWNCSTDTNIANQNNDCSGTTVWNMDNSSLWPFTLNPTSISNITNNQTGIVSFDVTQDVRSFINGSSQNYGWLIKKTDEGQTGRIQFGSRETANNPTLVITTN